MARFTHRQYQRHVSVTMVVYVCAMLLVWPLTRSTPELWMKALLACIPAIPMLYVIALLARKILGSDEMEQRAHLLALGVATGVVGAMSMVGGLLAAAGAVPLEGSILIWVFPVLIISYSISHWWILTRRFGGSTECDDGASRPVLSFLVLMSLIMGIVALVSWWQGRLDDTRLGMLAGMAVSVAAMSAFWMIRGFWRRKQARRQALEDVR
ncbi:hypothetical protein [Dyella sp.]|jgi:hypothetical protein|uniref:hypothetical protein n=1 Tax=Dyella sp. TaxID=1869338 RepID=UPI002D779A1A|nr:hypothetical protein [Dyella sp.]HET6431369.1 hypothetical protein [Dyella sp.]